MLTYYFGPEGGIKWKEFTANALEQNSKHKGQGACGYWTPEGTCKESYFWLIHDGLLQQMLLHVWFGRFLHPFRCNSPPSSNCYLKAHVTFSKSKYFNFDILWLYVWNIWQKGGIHRHISHDSISTELSFVDYRYWIMNWSDHKLSTNLL